MAALAVLDRQDYEVSDIEMIDDGDTPASYTSFTLDRLAARGMDTREIFFITGADAFRDIRTWKEYPAILDRCHFVAVSRPGQSCAGLRMLLAELAPRMVDAPGPMPAAPAIFLVDAPTAPVSSTAIRERIAGGESIEGMVPRDVAAHIEKHGLYRDTQ
jgi:nicotinate-nucleotide adenylyltransferase